MTRPPKKPISVMRRHMPAACSGENGVIHQSAVPTPEAVRAPPISPSQVLEGERLGATLVRPTSLPQTYCMTSDSCTTKIR